MPEINQFKTENDNHDTIKRLPFLLLVPLLVVLLILGYFAYNQFFKIETNEEEVLDDGYGSYIEDLMTMYSEETAPEEVERVVFSDDEKKEVPPLSGLLFFTSAEPGYFDIQQFVLDINNPDKPIEVFGEDMGVDVPLLVEFVNYPENYFALAFKGDGPHGTLQHYQGDTEPEAVNDPSLHYKNQMEYSSESGLLAYNRLNRVYENSNDLFPVENWEVVVYDPSIDAVLATVEGGLQPKWLPGGDKLIYLKKDGLYLNIVEEDTEVKLLGLGDEGIVVSTSMIDVSPDGKYILWTTAKRGVLTLLQFSEEEKITMVQDGEDIVGTDYVVREVYRLNSDTDEFYWPHFAPDSINFVVQGIDRSPDPSIERTNPRFEFRDIYSPDKKFEYDISAYNFDSFFTDDWVAN